MGTINRVEMGNGEVDVRLQEGIEDCLTKLEKEGGDAYREELRKEEGEKAIQAMDRQAA